MAKFLRIFTDLSLDEIKRLEALEGEEINEAKKVLANEATALAHGQAAAAEASTAASKTFEEGAIDENIPSWQLEAAQLKKGIGLLEAFVLTRLAASNSEARRQVRGRAVKVNDVLVEDEKTILTQKDINRGVIKLALGKKNVALLKIK